MSEEEETSGVWAMGDNMVDIYNKLLLTLNIRE